MFTQFYVAEMLFEKETTESEKRRYRLNSYEIMGHALSHSLRNAYFTERSCSRYLWTNACPLLPLFRMPNPVVPKSENTTRSSAADTHSEFHDGLTPLATSQPIRSTDLLTASNPIPERNQFDRVALGSTHRCWPLFHCHSTPTRTTTRNRFSAVRVSRGNS